MKVDKIWSIYPGWKETLISSCQINQYFTVVRLCYKCFHIPHRLI